MINRKRIPDHWGIKRLDEVGDIVSGGTPSTKDEDNWGEDIIWITASDLTGYQGKTIFKGKKSISNLGLSRSSARLMPKGSVLFSSRAPIGYVVIAGTELCTNQGFKSIIPNEKVTSDFLFHFLKFSKLKVQAIASGTTFKEISARAFASLIMPVPPLKEQHLIVEKIEELFSELDAARRQLETVKKQIDLYKQAVLKSAFEGGLSKNKIAEYENCYTWKITKIADVGEIVSGGTPSTKEPEYWDGDIPWITPADLSGYSNKYIDKGRRSITCKGLSKSSARIIPSGSVLLSSRAPIGYVAIAKNELCTNQGFKSIIPSSRVTSEYLYYFLKAHTQKIIERASGTTFKEVSLRTISSLEIIIPPIKQQKIIVAEIEHRFSFCDKMEETIFDNIQRSEALKQSILKQAFEGKLVKSQTNQQINCK